ncbi:alpha/beta hydrolase family protein [Hyphococcus sp.]|uniref:alpha/beta hydrolase family protein n=1 Tax=Hyphococcus sp. TaxID=2038636 RepID=UPI0020823253|nr:MAG: hypothetical protein DHS20C04_26680 [Marinicaulis sp.]
MIKNLVLAAALLIAAAAGVGGYNWLEFGRLHGAAEAVSFNSADGVHLQGTLISPNTPGPHPAIVILHGSGPSSGIGMFGSGHANAFLKHGIAVLIYDKRGCGESGGNFDTATYADFIDDAIASIEMLRKRSDIDAAKVALFGSSESGWFTPEIAERVGGVPFIINRAGPPLSWIETNLWEIRNELLNAGLTDENEIADFLQLREKVWRYYEQAAAAHDPLPELRAELEAEVARVDPRWLEATSMRVAEYEQEKFERYLVDILYDPAPYWERLNIPVFALHGGADQNVPTARAVEVFDRLRREGKSIEVIVYPGYKHGMAKYHNLFSMGYPPGYLPAVGEWAKQQFDT